APRRFNLLVGGLGAALGDLNGDGVADLALALSNGTAGVLLGNGDGTFQPLRTYRVGSAPSAIAVTDVNADGLLDLVTADSGAAGVSVLLGHGDGTFAAALRYNGGGAASFVVADDFNGDGFPDLAVSSFSGQEITVFLN